MGRRGGSALLPLHGGRVPPWLSTRMTALGTLITEAIVLHYGRAEFLRRLAHPFWFQSFGAVMGMDWHSSGITTSVMGALKRGLTPRAHELGIHVCGGRGKHSRKTPGELTAIGERTGLDGAALAHTSKLVAKVDSAAVQDGFDLYLHSFVVTDEGDWVVVQQGMNGERRQARRYHWLSERVRDFIETPHAAIDGPQQGVICNLTDARAGPNRAAQLELVAGGPDRIVEHLRKRREVEAVPVLRQAALPHLELPAHHEVRAGDVSMRRLHATLAAVADRGPRDFQQLLMSPGVGQRTLFSLAMVAEVVHGAPHRFSDPGRFSLAHGGKDGHPFPVPLRVYDQTLGTLRHAIGRAKLGQKDRMWALQRLDIQSRALERAIANDAMPSFADFIRTERRRSHAYGGMTVFGPAKPPETPLASEKPARRRSRKGDQLSLLDDPGA